MHIFGGFCLSLALYLHVPLVGDVSCLATTQSWPDCCHDNVARYHHGQNRDDRRKGVSGGGGEGARGAGEWGGGGVRPAIEGC